MFPMQVWETAQAGVLTTGNNEFRAEVTVRGGHPRFVVRRLESGAATPAVVESGTSRSVTDAMTHAETLLDRYGAGTRG